MSVVETRGINQNLDSAAAEAEQRCVAANALDAFFTSRGVLIREIVG